MTKMTYKEKFSLDYIGKSSKAKVYLEPTISLIKHCQFGAAEKSFAKTAIKLIKAVAAGEIESEEANEVFTILDKYISSNFDPPRPFNDLFLELLIEGMVIHHYGDGTGFGPDLDQMIRMAKKLLEDN